MDSEKLSLLAVAAVIIAAAVGIYTENKATETAISGGIPTGVPVNLKGRPLAN